MAQGCGYHFGLGELPSKYKTISVPYVWGDHTGELTSALIKEVSKSGAFAYKSCNGEIVLKVALIDVSEMNIGFRYDSNKEGEREDDIIPSETRLTALAEITVIEYCTGCVVLGPARIYATVEFDHDYYFGSDRTNVESLGQLTDYDAAYDAAQTPLYKTLSEKIVDYVINSW